MSQFARYLSRLILMRFLLILSGMVAFAYAFDLLEVAGQVAASNAYGYPLMTYTLLRLPGLVADLLPIATMLAALLAYGEIIRHREIVAIWNSGVSPLVQLRMLLPLGLFFALLQFAVSDGLAPSTTAALRDWEIGQFKERDDLRDSQGFLWLYKDREVLRLRPPKGGEASLDQVWLFRRGADGLITEQLHAQRAEWSEKGWQLMDVELVGPENPGGAYVQRYALSGDLAINDLTLLGQPPDELSLAAINYLSADQGWRARPGYLYKTQRHYRVAHALFPCLLLLLVVAMAQRFRSIRLPVRLALGVIVTGLGFQIFSKTALFIGEAGLLPPPLAAWGPLAALACVIAAFTIHPEAGRVMPEPTRQG